MLARSIQITSRDRWRVGSSIPPNPLAGCSLNSFQLYSQSGLPNVIPVTALS
jgi:hypothetical protein